MHIEQQVKPISYTATFENIDGLSKRQLIVVESLVEARKLAIEAYQMLNVSGYSSTWGYKVSAT